MAANPIACGALVDAGGWWSIFLVNVPIGLAVLLLTLGRAVTSPRDERRIDWLVQLAAAIGLALLTDALITAGARSWTHALWSSAGALTSVAIFLVLERRSSTPVLNRALLRAGRVRAGLLAGAAVSFALTGGLFVQRRWSGGRAADWAPPR